MAEEKNVPMTWGTAGKLYEPPSKARHPGSPRIYELIETLPTENKDPRTPTIWAWPEVVDMLRIAGQPVPGPWPPNQNPRPDPSAPGYEAVPVAVAEPRGAEESAERRRPAGGATPPRRRSWSGKEPAEEQAEQEEE